MNLINLWVFTVGAKCILGQSWDDNQIHCLASEMTKATFPEMVGAPRLCRFPRWPPNNLSSSGLIVSFYWQPLNSVRTKVNEWSCRAWEAFTCCLTMLWQKNSSGNRGWVWQVQSALWTSFASQMFWHFRLKNIFFITSSRREDFKTIHQAVFSNRIHSSGGSLEIMVIRCCDSSLKIL